MVELLSYLNNIKRYTLADIVDKKITINISSEEELNAMLDIIDNLQFDVVNYRYYDTMCIRVRKSRTSSLLVTEHSYREWYLKKDYTVINMEDMIWPSY